ncbi:MAG: PepSY domain-containing protein [Rhodospirillaceae bacterium]|nr:PepSY domain-containing protein [Rhodospirillaceae bacterium]
MDTHVVTDLSLPAQASGRSLRQIISVAHLWAGLICGIPAAAIAITGAVVMLRHQRPITIEAATYITPPSIDAILAAAQKAIPGGAAPQQYQPATPTFPAVVQYGVAPTQYNPRGIARILIDPVSLAIVPDSEPPTSAFTVFARNFHVNLLAGNTGRVLVGAVGALMLVLGVSGLVQWWPKPGRWREAFLIRGRGSALIILREIHGAAGIWGLIVFLFVAGSGAIIAFPAAPPPAPPPSPNAQANVALSPAPPSADAAVTIAMTARPDAVLRQVDLPRAPGGAFRIGLSRVGDVSLAPMMSVSVDGAATRVIAVADPAELPLPDRLRTWLRPMHEGGGVGWVWWTLVLISSILPTVFICSGTAMWLIKRRNRARVR